MHIYPKLIVTHRWRERLAHYASEGVKVFELTSNEVDIELLSLSRYRGSVTVVVGDIAASPKIGLQLLKFLEEVQFPLVCLASRDCFSSVLLSRFLTIEKDIPVMINTGSSFQRFLGLLQDKKGPAALVMEAPSYTSLLLAFHHSRLPAKAKLFHSVVNG